MENTLLEECFGDSSLYLYMSVDSVYIHSEEKLCNDRYSNILEEVIDFSPIRKKPFVGEILKQYIVDEYKGVAISQETNWQVYKVDQFLSNNDTVAREIVIAWCKKI